MSTDWLADILDLNEAICCRMFEHSFLCLCCIFFSIVWLLILKWNDHFFLPFFQLYWLMRCFQVFIINVWINEIISYLHGPIINTMIFFCRFLCTCIRIYVLKLHISCLIWKWKMVFALLYNYENACWYLFF